VLVPAEIWKRPDVAARFLNEQSLSIPDRPRQLEVLLRVLGSRSRPLGRVLDLGTGDGLLLATVLDAFPEATGVALDFSQLMLEQARQRLTPFGARVRIVEADLQTPAWRGAAPGPFDAIVSGFAIHHLTHERKRALYREIHKLLSEGSVFLNSEHVSSPTPRVERLFDEAMTDQLYSRRLEKGEHVSREQVFQEFLQRPDRAANILASVEEQCQWLREQGFQDVDCFWKYFELAIFGGTK
jgi:cyclopropane fatty-acyl-phospholipid synthase-like methyltransferase